MGIIKNKFFFLLQDFNEPLGFCINIHLFTPWSIQISFNQHGKVSFNLTVEGGVVLQIIRCYVNTMAEKWRVMWRNCRTEHEITVIVAF